MKSKMLRAMACVLALALAAALTAGCGFISRASNGDIVIAGGELYEVNDREALDLQGVDKISISGVSDKVTVRVGKEPSAELTGQCRSVGDPVKLEVSKTGGKLIVEVKYPNNVIRSSNTDLVVTLPEEYEGGLSASTVSGGIVATSLPLRLTQVHLNTVSGGIQFNASCESLEAGTISGSVEVGGITGPTTVTTVSGEVVLAYDKAADTKVDTVSGSVGARVPKDASFQIDFSSVSGSFRSSHSGINVSKAGSGFSASVGEGGALIKVSTTSGSFKLEE